MENNKRRGGMRRRKVCQFCADKEKKIDYKDVETLKKYTTERGKILPRRVTGTCAMHQRAVTSAIKRARVVALIDLFIERERKKKRKPPPGGGGGVLYRRYFTLMMID